MFKYLTIITIIFTLCFSGVKVGLDFQSEFESEYGSSDLDKGFSIAFDNQSDESKWGTGFEYLMPTKIEDSGSTKLSMISLYGMYEFSRSDETTIFGKIGYSKPFIDEDLDINGGVMYGIQFNFSKIQVSYTIHNGKIEGYYEDLDVDFNRFVLYYPFN